MTNPTPAFTLYSGPLSMFGAKVQIAALEKDLAFDLQLVPFDFHKLYTPKHPEVLRINPKQQVPVLVAGDLELFDSTQIFEYLEDLRPDVPLWPAGINDRARSRLLEHKADEVYFPHIVKLMSLQDKLGEQTAIDAIEAAGRYYVEMEGLLGKQAWLAGEYSFADIAFYMAQLFGARQSAPMGSATPRLLAWRDRMSARPAVKQVVAPMAEWLVAAGRPLPPFMQAMR